MKLYLFLLPLSNFCCMSLLGMVKYISIIGFFNIHSKQVNKAFNEVNNGVLMNIAQTLQHTYLSIHINKYMQRIENCM